ncbi:TcfC E-set like domain-containing protein [Vibrio sp. BS-M-Sm-2]|uniref:TcfC E-set like domain-containing protein n=1 Tax=Vibrio sp. BS-M-Sm-2 TaxID=3241167 RepID=UPI003558FC2F
MLKKILVSTALCFTLPLVISEAYSQTAPEGFEHLFELKETSVRIRNLDGSLSSPVTLLTSFKLVKLDQDNSESFSVLADYLEKNSIKKSYQQQIISDLLNGIEDESLCLGELEQCQIFPETYELVHNYNDQELYLFISPEGVDYKRGGETTNYHSVESRKNGLINSFDLYVSAYQDSDNKFSLNDESVLGLNYGYLKSDFNISNGNEFELYEAGYHLDIDAYALKVGHFEFAPELNSTDFLRSTARFSQDSVTVGSSDKLIIGGVNSDKVLSFYVPVSGSVQVYRDERVIYQRNVSEGQNAISYDELPRGRYEARVDVSSGGEVVNSQSFQVYNSTGDTLSPGGMDYLLSAGMFADSNEGENTGVDSKSEDNVYFQALGSYQLIDSVQLGAGALTSELGNMFTLGGTLNLFQFGLDSEAVYSQFDDANHLSANISIPYINLGYEELENDNEDPVASRMYGRSNYSRVSLNSSYSFGRDQSLYASYSLTNANASNGLESDSESELLSLGYSTSAILDSRFNINVDYSHSTDDAQVNLLWTVPLSTKTESITALSSDKDGVNQFKTTLRRNEVIKSDTFDSSVEVSNTYARRQNEMYQDGRLTVSGTTEYARMNGSLTGSSNGNLGVDASLSSTQIITSDDVYLTDKHASAYTLVDIEQSEFDKNSVEEKGYFTLKKQGKDNNKFIVYRDETIIPLQDFNSYEATFESESVDLYNAGGSEAMVFSHPGTVATIEPKIRRLVSFVTAFNNISEEPVIKVECSGEGCVDVNEMTNGVYRVTVLEGMDFELTSDGTQCLLPYQFNSTSQLNFGQNYCLPIAKTDTIQNIEYKSESLNALFLGAFEVSDKLTQSMNKLEYLGYNLIKKDIGRYKAIYISHKSNKLQEVLATHANEIEKFKLMAKNMYKTNSIFYPVAKIN